MKAISSTTNQITMLDLVGAYCQKEQAGKILAIWLYEENSEIDYNSSLEANKIFGELEGYIPVSVDYAFSGELVIHEVSEKLAMAMLRKAHDHKWGFGSIFYVWFNDHLCWGRD